MCSGRVDSQFVLSAFRAGADGVLVLACPSGTCHYRDGNRQSFKRHLLLKRMLTGLGVEAARIGFESVSANEGTRFVEIVEGMIHRVRMLGPMRFHYQLQRNGTRGMGPGATGRPVEREL